MNWTKRSTITKAQLDQLELEAASVTSLESGFGTYDAIVGMADGTMYRVTTERLNPIGDVDIKQIDQAIANRLMRE